MIHKRIFIWEDNEYKGADKDFKPTLTTYILDNKDIRNAVLIFPGGGYAYTSPREAECIALKFNSAGYNAFVLDYSVAPSKHPQPLCDASRAMCLIRRNAKEWKTNPEKIAVVGFSAGGHLACSLGVFYNKDYLMKLMPDIKKDENKPNAMILCYPVITGGGKRHDGSFINLLGDNLNKETLNELSLERHVTKDTPQSFIWHTFSDSSVPVENSLLLANALKENNVPFELHIYPKGIHGLSLADKETCEDRDIDPHVGTWIKLCIEWLDGIFK